MNISNNNLIKCNKIKISCVPNTSLDFEFDVFEDDIHEMRNFITSVLVIFEIPVAKVDVKEGLYLPEDEVWTKKRIFESISDKANSLRSEAKKGNADTSHIKKL